MVRKTFAAGGIAVLSLMAGLTIAFGTSHQAHADNKFGGAGDTITQTTPPTALETQSVAPAVKATPYGGEGA